MVETGVPKFVSMKNIGWVIGVIVIVIAIFVAWRYIRAVFGEYIDVPTKGEKARFMRYVACAIAMCSASNRQEGSIDGCTSDRVMELEVEYDEKGELVKGCQKICWEIRDQVGSKEHYCGKDYAINFTFKDDVKYVGNYSCEGLEGIIKGRKVENCGTKKGWQTDFSLFGNWQEKILSCVCYNTPSGEDTPPEGLIMKYQNGDECKRETGLCGGFSYSRFPSLFWVSEDFANERCKLATDGPVNNPYMCSLIGRELAWCEFKKGDEPYYIWAEDAYRNPGGMVYWIWGVISFCQSGFGDEQVCPQVIICNHKP